MLPNTAAALNTADYRRRNVIERRCNQLKQWRALATRYDKLAIVYRPGPHAVIAWAAHLSGTP
ncbi:hypothetical protein [Mycobacterium sp.]|jgi:transposase|uniref:hypothetical protein n=1 Tax=Mycobacterium sp. TaxID=1785 RepID=UPI003F957458